MASFRFALGLMVAAGAGCASSGVSSGGTGGGSGDAGTGGTMEDGGAPGTGDAGQNHLAELQLSGALSVAGEEWIAFEPSCPTYHYQIRDFGSCGTTTVALVNEQPVERSFTSDAVGCTPAADAGVLGDPARTVQELINYCPTIFHMYSAKYSFSFTYGGHGVPTTCTATLINCADNCTTGFEISNFGCDQIPAG